MQPEPLARMTRSIDLDGDGWSIREALGQTWQWYLNAPPPAMGNNVADAAAVVAATPGWIPARVPGSVIGDLMRAGELEDPRVGRNSRAAEWVAERSWVYRRAVTLPPPAAGERVVLELDGVDPEASVFWDGIEIGRTAGLYRAARFELTAVAADAPSSALRGGGHLLAIVVHPAPDSQPQVGRTDLVRVHAPRVGYGWDFCPRMRHQGIWKSARIVIGALQLTGMRVRADLDEGLSRGVVAITAVLEAGLKHGAEHATERSAEAEPADEVDILAELSLDGRVVASRHLAATPGEVALKLEVDTPELWWPNGFGRQALYTLRVQAGHGGTGAERRVGFRNIRWSANPDAPADALPYTAVVNGVRVPLIGWNWAPADALYGTIRPERVRHLVHLAADSGARLLRVWGGGLVESETFYGACDDAGLLVWQEFSQSSSGMQSAPATDAGFVALMRAEAEAIVPTLTQHPSLAIWGGGNELDSGGVPLNEERSPVLAALAETVHRLDPGRYWLPTSPTGPEFHNRLDRIRANPSGQHDVHGPWEHQGLEAQHTLYNAGTALAHTEFGVEGMTNLRCLLTLIPEAHLWPTDRSNPVYRHLGEWWNNCEFVQRVFAHRLHTVEQVQRASQLLQSTGLQYAIEADRRREPRCSMVLAWQLNESFPNAWCTSSVDYRGDAKPAYYAVARAFAPQRASVRTERSAWAGHETARAEAWLWSEPVAAGLVPEGGSVTLRLLTMAGSVLGETAVPLGEIIGPVAVARLDVPLTDARAAGESMVMWHVQWRDAVGRMIDDDRVLASTTADLAGLLELETSVIETDLLAGADADATWVRVRHRSGPTVVGLRFVDARPIAAPGWAVIDGDPRPLMPGEERRVRVRWRDDDPDGFGRLLGVESWNTNPTCIDSSGIESGQKGAMHDNRTRRE